MGLTNAFQTSYGSMSSIVDHVFPPTSQSPQMALDYSSFTFWREPLPNIIAEEESLNIATTAAAAGEGQPEPETDVNEKNSSNSDLVINAKIGELDKSDTSSSSSSSQTTIMETVLLETDSNQIVH